jgi:arsenical-resistance protein
LNRQFSLPSKKNVQAGESSDSFDSSYTKLSLTDKLLPIFILLAMMLGLLFGKLNGAFVSRINSLQVTKGVSLLIFLGLLLMLYPPLAKIKYHEFKFLGSSKKQIFVSVIFNWLLGPAVMFILAWIFLPDSSSLRTGLILVGIARCIAMVVLWSDMAKGDSELTALLVLINSIFQITAYSVLAYLYLTKIPSWLHLGTAVVHISFWLIAENILIYLGIPLLLGFITRLILEQIFSRKWYETIFCNKIGHVATFGLIFTIFMLFSISGKYILKQPLLILNVAVALIIYFLVMFFSAFFTGYKLKFSYEKTASLAFTASGNNFELAIAVAIGIFGISSNQTLAGITGPMVEIPTLVLLTYLSRNLSKYFIK